MAQVHGTPGPPGACGRRWTGAALLLIDVINPLDFDGGDRLLETALPAAHRIAALKAAMCLAGVPVIYVNDNFGHWDLGLAELAARHRRAGTRGRPIIELLAPRPGDHFVLKPKHSGFYGTSFELLLQHLGARRLILTGFAANICVWFTANDAHMRDYQLIVPDDCTAAEAPRDAEYVLEEDDIGAAIVCGPDSRRHAEAIQAFWDAGYDHVYVHQVGPDQESFFRLYEEHVLPEFQ